MSFYDSVSLVNIILPFIASVGYLIRIIIGIKKGNTSKFRVMLFLFLFLSVGSTIIYIFALTGWWKFLESDYEAYSRVYIRPYFTFLGSVLVLASWSHPELNPLLKKIKEARWIQKFKKK